MVVRRLLKYRFSHKRLILSFTDRSGERSTGSALPHTLSRGLHRIDLFESQLIIIPGDRIEDQNDNDRLCSTTDGQYRNTDNQRMDLALLVSGTEHTASVFISDLRL